MLNHQYMLQALSQAKKGKGQCAPNPAVGAVIVKDNQVLAVGYHKEAGLPHAEVEAISQLSDFECAGAEMFVTLEPCSHFGRTPPCADLIIQKKFKAVYFGFLDPNPLVQGKGREKILKAGIHCEQINLSEINQFYQSYVYWIENKRPVVTAKVALSLDGKIAETHKSQIKLTNKEADLFTHQQRYWADGILSTADTVILDNPKFNARLPDGHYQKKLFLIDTKLKLPLFAEIFQTTKSITLFHSENANKSKFENKNIHFFGCSETEEGLNLKEIINILGEIGLQDVWVEAGSKLLNSLLKLNLLNRLIVYVCPIILGPKAWPSFLEIHKLPEPTWQQLGSDVMAQFEF